MRISNVRVLLLSAPIPPEQRWTSDLGTNTKAVANIRAAMSSGGCAGFSSHPGSGSHDWQHCRRSRAGCDSRHVHWRA
jgi:hypothetical protein